MSTTAGLDISIRAVTAGFFQVLLCNMIAARFEDLVYGAVVLIVVGLGVSCSSGSAGSAAAPLEQVEALADGEVTFAEYDRAVRENIFCIQDQGFTVQGPMGVNWLVRLTDNDCR